MRDYFFGRECPDADGPQRLLPTGADEVVRIPCDEQVAPSVDVVLEVPDVVLLLFSQAPRGREQESSEQVAVRYRSRKYCWATKFETKAKDVQVRLYRLRLLDPVRRPGQLLQKDLRPLEFARALTLPLLQLVEVRITPLRVHAARIERDAERLPGVQAPSARRVGPCTGYAVVEMDRPATPGTRRHAPSLVEITDARCSEPPRWTVALVWPLR
jgi:hypothetical protein